MNRLSRISTTLLTICLFHPFAWGQMSHEEEVVRNAYAKVEFLSEVHAVGSGAISELRGDKIDQATLQKTLADATPRFELSNFRTGTVESIANEEWGQFFTPLPRVGSVLESVPSTDNFSDLGNPSSWLDFDLSWKPTQPYAEAIEAEQLSLPISKILTLASPQWSTETVTYIKYAAFTVNAIYQGKSTGPYKAIFFFGTDQQGNEVVAPNDLVAGGQGIWAVLKEPAYPNALLQSRLRDTPVVKAWIGSSQMPAVRCSSPVAAVCCAQGRCGLSQSNISHDLALPLPGNKLE